jgi:hypothetical protein
LYRFSFLFLLLSAPALFAQQLPPAPAITGAPAMTAQAELPDAPDALLANSTSAPAQTGQPTAQQAPAASRSTPPPQPKRILGLMPNYRAVSAGVKPSPPTPKQAFTIATRQSFDYSSFVFVGLTSMIAEGDDSHPQLGKGVPGFWAYSWRGWLDKTDGNYWVVWILPTALHEDERYYALGRGPVVKRLGYAVSRVFVTPDYNGHLTVNASELLGRGVAQGIGLSYYPASDRSASSLATKYGYALLRDGATNAFREVWPDIAVHVFHRNP